MFKIFEGIGSIIAIACLIEMASNPKQVVRDIQNGPVPSLSKLNESSASDCGTYFKSSEAEIKTGQNGLCRTVG